MDFRKSAINPLFFGEKAILLCSLISVAALAPAGWAEAQSEHGRQVVKFIDPLTVPPLIGSAPWNAGGPAEHRMIVDHAGSGSTHLDIGYNTYKKGVVLSRPYAYKIDEVCLIPSGHIRLTDEDGSVYDRAGGQLMWRPAGAVTKLAEFLEDTITICSMAPARLDANSHRVSPQDLGEWNGDPAKKPRLHWISIETAPIVKSGDNHADSGMLEREVLSRRKDGSARISVVHIAINTGSYASSDTDGEEICWVAKGVMRVASGGREKTVSAGTFFYKPEGVKISRIEATNPASATCFSSPAAF